MGNERTELPRCTSLYSNPMTDSPATVYVTVVFPADEYRRLLPLRREDETAAAFVRRLAIAGGRVLTAEAALKVSP